MHITIINNYITLQSIVKSADVHFLSFCKCVQSQEKTVQGHDWPLSWKCTTREIKWVWFNCTSLFCGRSGRHGGVQHNRQQRVWYSGRTGGSLGDTDHVCKLWIRGKELVCFCHSSDLISDNKIQRVLYFPQPVMRCNGCQWMADLFFLSCVSQVMINSRGLVYSVVLLLGSVALTVSNS